MSRPSTYIFSPHTTAVETERLDLLEALLDPRTIHYIAALGVHHGDRCLEVAAGGGSIAMHLLCLCGKAGEVVATDIDLRWLDPVEHPPLTKLRHDIVQDDPADLGTFDFIHVRLLLTHLSLDAAAQVVETLVSMLRPGGRILIEDYELHTSVDHDHPDAAAWERDWQRWFEFFATVGSFAHGTRLPRLLQDLGLRDVGSEVNHTYLQSNGVDDGVQSYGRVVDLLVAERRARKAAATE